MGLASRLRPLWPLIAALVSGAMLAVAHFYFERYLNLPPCPLCLDQREWHWAVVAVGLTGFALLQFKPAFSKWAAAAVGLVFLLSFASIPIFGVRAWPAGAAYHVAVEEGWAVAQCDVGAVDAGDLRFDVNRPLEVPRCDEKQEVFLGVSIAGFNAILSLLMALLSFAIALLPERKS